MGEAKVCHTSHVTRHTSHVTHQTSRQAPEEVLAGPPQEKVNADELDPAELNDGHESGLDSVAEHDALFI